MSREKYVLTPPPYLFVSIARLQREIKVLVGFLAFLLAISIWMIWILDSYFGIDYFASLSFPGSDGWCPVGVKGLGTHCWGDYSAIRFELFTSVPNGPESVYPLTSRLFRIPFWLVENLAGFRIGLGVYLIVLVILMALPMIHATRRFDWASRLTLFAVGLVGTAPFLITFDRGNLIFVLVPLLYIYLVGVRSGRSQLVALSCVLMCMVKPQFILLAVILIGFKFWWPLIETIALAFAGYLAVYVIAGRDNPIDSMRETFEASQQWLSGTEVTSEWPVNLSFEHFGSLLVKSLNSDWYWGATAIRGVLISIFTLIVVSLIVRQSRQRLQILAIALVVIAAFAVPVSFAYYGVVSLAIFAFLILAGAESKPLRLSRSISSWLLVCALALSLTPLVVPKSIAETWVSGNGAIVSNWISFISPLAWLVYLVSVLYTVWLVQPQIEEREISGIGKP